MSFYVNKRRLLCLCECGQGSRTYNAEIMLWSPAAGQEILYQYLLSCKVSIFGFGPLGSMLRLQLKVTNYNQNFYADNKLTESNNHTCEDRNAKIC